MSEQGSPEAPFTFSIITLFPEMFESFLRAALLGKALKKGAMEVGLINPRDFADGKHKSVDDTPYGGGQGMVMMAPPVVAALERAAKHTRPPHRILLTPQGTRFSQQHAERLSQMAHLALVCGRYEGVDERVRDHVDEELSLGDFVLFGGETAAMAIVEAVSRLLPNVLGNEASSVDESFSGGVLEHAQYTRPAVFRGSAVPDVLLSGHHQEVARHRRRQALQRTRRLRPDLFERLELSPDDRALLDQEEGECP